ncbi:uncharacterized protein BXZ73DRAFT_105365 [Epithele typhae]|uniref:uncharacterized protein n=1 Tax=Epithele typhae TaxID=378194 RepID=UPI0020077D6F|nr:uncharacterized protein BXZ73DRAFT_105365 [Epithele typhae]KAH9918240.1 hypothetical protein BXZ73DRAFT_105365 [Epithele typhae]
MFCLQTYSIFPHLLLLPSTNSPANTPTWLSLTMAAVSSAPEQTQSQIDEETLARLRNVGSRVRKSVTEGFQRTVSVPANPQQFATTRLPFTNTPFFISSNDAMREMIAQREAVKNKGPASAPSSPQQRPKRIHNGADEDSDVEPLGGADDDIEVDLSDDEDMSPSARAAALKLREEKAKREILPLKRSASRGAGTQSLPPSMFRFSHEGQGAAGKSQPAVEKIEEEEDWSGNFGGAGNSVVNLDLELS